MSNQTMSLDELDLSLQDWAGKRATATQNVLALMALVTYKWLVGSSTTARAPLTGQSKVRVEPALEALDELWCSFPLLTQVLDRAAEMRKDMPRIRQSERIREIQDLLEGASIKLPATKTPLAERGLLTAAETANSISPQRLLEAMEKAYLQGKEVVLLVKDALDRNSGALQAASTEVDELEKLAKTLGEDQLTELTSLKASLAQLTRLVQSDPLGVKDGFDSDVVSALEPVRTRLNELSARRGQVDSDLVKAAAELALIEQTHERAKELAAERKSKTTVENESALAMPFDDSVLTDGRTGLRPWLERLQASVNEGKWKPAYVGLQSWLSQAGSRLARAQTAVADNEAPLLRRRELRGLLDALKAKAIGTGLAENAELAALYEQAKSSLYTRPTVISQAEKLVFDYEARLR